MVLPAELGETLHSKANRVRGITVVSRRKDWPGTTSLSSTALVPCLVFIVPVVPAANGPVSVIDWTSGFHSGHVLVSDQILQAAWGLAVVSTERSLLANPTPPSIASRCGPSRGSAEGISRRPR